MKKPLQNILEKTIAILSIIFCITIAFLDFAGWLDGIPVIANRVPIISLLLLAGITSYLVISYPTEEENRHAELVNLISQVDETIKSIDLLGARVQTFKNTEASLYYANHRIKRAKTKVSLVYSDPTFDFTQESTTSILYREIFAIDHDNSATFKQKIQERSNSEKKNYGCAYYQAENNNFFQFIIIDSSEIIFLSSLSANNLAVIHPQIVHLFQFHFDELWSKAKRLS